MTDTLLDAADRSVIDATADAFAASTLVAAGAAVAHGFGNFYAITTRGDAETVRRVNALKGRPDDQVGSITAPSDQVMPAFDRAAFPDLLPPSLVEDVVAALTRLGPFGFRGPAAPHIPDHLTSRAGAVRTTQVIVPGLACPSNRFLEMAADAVAPVPLFVTSANRSRHRTGAVDEPAHWSVEALRRDFEGARGMVVLEHSDEAAARARFPLHAPMSTTILGLHRAEVVDGRICLPLERHGSLDIADVRVALDRWGLGLVVEPAARTRLEPRRYGVEPRSDRHAGSVPTPCRDRPMSRRRA